MALYYDVRRLTSSRPGSAVPGKVTLYWKPGWTGCRSAKEFLSRAKVEVELRDLFKRPLSVEEIAALSARLAGGDLRSRRSAEIETHGIDPDAPVTERTMALMAKEPRLVRRPILDTGREVVVGFDRRRYAELFGGA
jgi:arsenate reductase-like glutaredoxin family protein